MPEKIFLARATSLHTGGFAAHGWGVMSVMTSQAGNPFQVSLFFKTVCAKHLL